MTDKRLIEIAFPLQQASLDSVYEKTVRHGHISTLHMWPARRPLAASRAALIATLLPSANDPLKRKEILERLAGKVVAKDVKKTMPSGKTEIVKTYETVGGILHWGRESGPDLDWFREEIRKSYRSRAPKVLDPFAGGGAIPLEAMRLGCEVTAVDINPVAWFILKCTLEYPQKLAGQKLRLPDFAVADPQFMREFFKAQGLKGAALRSQLAKLFGDDGAPKQHDVFDDLEPLLEADLAWHVRAWGRWVHREARKELARFYPTYARFEAVDGSNPKGKGGVLELVPLNAEGDADVSVLNREFSKEYLENPRKPRWVSKPTAAYLWARTVVCKNCRAILPLLKTRWLCKKDNRRVVLEITPKADRSGVEFSINQDAKVAGHTAAARREHDKRLGSATMSRSGAQCPCCHTIMTMEDIRQEGRAGRLATAMTVVVTDGPDGKEFRAPTLLELTSEAQARDVISSVFEGVPFGLPTEPLASSDAPGFRVPLYGIDQWFKLFTPRQLVALGTIVKLTRSTPVAPHYDNTVWAEAVRAYLAAACSRLVDFCSTGVQWKVDVPTVNHFFVRFALPITWDFAEANVLWGGAGSYLQCLDRIMTPFLDQSFWRGMSVAPHVLQQSVLAGGFGEIDVVVTDPPYYDAIPYSDVMDYFYVWLRRSLKGLSIDYDRAFNDALGPKWRREQDDGELIDDSSRFGGDHSLSKQNYEQGMARAFVRCHESLKSDGRLVIVFAHKHPDAWETLVAAIIRSGFVVDASWPIQTEQASRMRAQSSAALSSSVWLVCRKRPDDARPGWDNRVLEDMHRNITQSLREFWDAGIRGPDFVWAATGPALEAYSQHPVVKKANSPGELMSVTEFLQHVRRIVVDFVVGRVLSGDGAGEDAASGLDDVTTYYLLHRHDFGFKEAPAGACILYAVSCGLTDRALSDQYDLVLRSTGGGDDTEDEGSEREEIDDEDGSEAAGSGAGSALTLKAWNRRSAKDLGLDAPRGKPVPLIDQVHRIMRLWKAGDLPKVDDYLDQRLLRANRVFHQLLQALIELAAHASEERSLLESISNHVAARGIATQADLID